MVWSGLFDRSILPAALLRPLRVPAAMIGAGLWIIRLALRAALGGSRRARASH
jgi:hypothetical protein